MVGCLFFVGLLLLLAVAMLLIPLGTALSFGQGFVVVALLAAATRTAWAAWRHGGALALVVERGDEETCFPALPQDENGTVAVDLWFGPADRDGDPDADVDADGDADADIAPRVHRPDPTAATPRPRLVLTRPSPSARRGRLELTLRGLVVWSDDLELGRPAALPEATARRLGAGGDAPVRLTFLDR